MVDVIETFKLNEKNYVDEIHKKTQIVLGNTLSIGMDHFEWWSKKVNGKFKGTAAFTIAQDGQVYNHYDPKYYSKFIKLYNWDERSIPIVLENEGWLIKDFKKNKLRNWCGDEYSKNEETAIYIKWRGKFRWAPYSEEQINSLAELCGDLCEKFDIPLICATHNTKIDDISEKQGIYSRSNYSVNYLDVSPAFNFEEFKKQIKR